MQDKMKKYLDSTGRYNPLASERVRVEYKADRAIGRIHHSEKTLDHLFKPNRHSEAANKFFHQLINTL